MTIIAVVRTGSAAVLAADSKLTTMGIGGRQPDGKPIFVTQTFDNAIKIAQDETASAIAGFAGHGLIGNQTVTDYFAMQHLTDLRRERPTQEEALKRLVADMVEQRRAFYEPLGASEIAPETVVILAAPNADPPSTRVWQITLRGNTSDVLEILHKGGVWLAGACHVALPLLYGFGLGGPAMHAFWNASGAPIEDFNKGLAAAQLHAHVTRINFIPMPVQDAIDFAVFCAKAQVDLERFMPGTPMCGGPIDVMTLETAPDVRIHSFPGKTLHHPHTAR
jgi:hypothetical protein